MKCVCPDLFCPCQFVHVSHAQLMRERFETLQQMVEDLRREVEPRHPVLATLTPRELEVLPLLRAGKSNAEIGFALGITERTVRAHTSAIYEKFGVKNRIHFLAA